VRDSPYLRVEPLVATLESRIENDVHALRSEESGGNFPALPRRRASRAQRTIFFSVTSSPARSMSASSSFLGIMTKSSFPARVLGIVMVAMLPIYHTRRKLFAHEVELLNFLCRERAVVDAHVVDGVGLGGVQHKVWQLLFPYCTLDVVVVGWGARRMSQYENRKKSARILDATCITDIE
jgi:hypothetical protein